MGGISAFIKGTPESSLSPSAREDTVRRGLCEPGGGGLTSHGTRRHLTLDFPPPDCEKRIALVCKAPSLCCLGDSSPGRLRRGACGV